MSDGGCIVIAGGGTGGHVYPGLALADALVAARPGLRVRWVGTRDRVEATAVPRAGYPIDFIDVRFLKGRRGLKLLGAAARLPKAGVQSMALLARHKPLAVIGVGGFASGPIAAAAAAFEIPVFLLEQNAAPGATNKALARFARRIYVSFDSAATHFDPRRVEVAGNPLRGNLLAARKTDKWAPSAPVRLLVVGGSQGAASLNEGMPRVAAGLQSEQVEFEVWHAAGPGRGDGVRADYRACGVEARVDDYLHDMASAYGWADLVIARAGATTITELTALGLPAMYVPFPAAADDHQTANARAVVEGGGGVMVKDDEMRDGERPRRILSPLLRHPEVLKRLSRAARRMGRADAAPRIAHDILSRIGASS